MTRSGQEPSPPRLGTFLLAVCLPRRVRDHVVGDLGEAFARRAAAGPQWGLKRWYWRQAASLAAHYLLRGLLHRGGGGRRVDQGREGVGMTMHGTGADLRMAFRTFRKAPGFTLASVLVLALGLGAVTFMFSTLDAVALRPLPYPDPDRLVWMWFSSDQNPRNSISLENYSDYRDQVEGFESLAAFLTFRPSVALTGDGEPERAVSNLVTANLFPTLGVTPVLGRGFTDADGLPGADPVVVLAHGTWLRRFGGATSALGSILSIDGLPYEVVGIMPRDFDFPGGVDLWLPSRTDQGYAQGRGNNNFLVVGRLRADASLLQVQAQADVVARQLEAAYPESNMGWGVHLVTLHERFFAGVRQALVMLLGMVALVLLIACANVASLALARATTRMREVAIRISLGAARGRVIRQLLTEHMVVAFTGGALGILFAAGGVRVLKAWAPAGLPRLESVSIDPRAVLFALTAATVTGLLFGTVPAFRGTVVSLSESLKAGGRAVGGGRSGGRAALVVAQIALTLTLMIGSGLLMRSFLRLQEVDLGFDATNLLTAQVQVPEGSYQEREAALQVWDQVRAGLAGLPGVQAVGAIDQLPVGGGGTWNGVFAQGQEPERRSDYLPAERRFVTEDFIEALGLPLLEGRTFETTDDLGSTRVTVVTASLAEALWPGESALGRYLVLPWDPPIPLEIVGIVGDIRDQGPTMDPRHTFYMPSRQINGVPSVLRFVMRTAGDPMAVAGSLRQTVWAVDANLPVSSIQTMEDRVEGSINQPKFRATLLGLFALTALILAALGLYAVLAFSVRQRTHEIAVRVAMGAGAGNVTRLVLRQGLTLAGVGVGLGLLGGLVGGRILQSFLFGVDPADPLTLTSVSATMLVVALLASLLPARRAVRVTPVVALNAE